MRKLSYVIAAALAMPAAAQAQELDRATQRLELAANAPVACIVSQPSVGGQANATFISTSASSGQVNITEFVDPVNATSLASSIELSLPMVCNASHSVRVSSANGGLLRGGAVSRTSSEGFSEFLPYNVGVDWSGRSVDLLTTNNTADLAVSDPGKGDITIRIATPAGSGPLIAGQYTDSIVVEVQPAS